MLNGVHPREFVFHRNHSLSLVISGIQTHSDELRSHGRPWWIPNTWQADNIRTHRTHIKLTEKYQKNYLPIIISLTPTYILPSVNTYSIQGFSSAIKSHFLNAYEAECVDSKLLCLSASEMAPTTCNFLLWITCEWDQCVCTYIRLKILLFCLLNTCSV